MFDGRWRHHVDQGTKPVGEVLRRSGVTANQLTCAGLVFAAAACGAIASGHLMWGLAAMILSGLPDLLDGPVAKASGSASVRGAFLDSVSDRVSDSLLFGGVAWYLMSAHRGHGAMLAVAVIASTMLVSYERAKAESLGLSAKGGIMERAERYVALGLALLLSQWMVEILAVILALTLATAVGRFVKVWRQAPGPAGVQPVRVRRREGTPAATWRERHVGNASSRWRARRADAMASRSSRFALRERAMREKAHRGAGRGSSRTASASSRGAPEGRHGAGGTLREFFVREPGTPRQRNRGTTDTPES